MLENKTVKIRFRLAAGLMAALVAGLAQAALFEDDEARRAILELRQRVDGLRQESERQTGRAGEDAAQLRRSLLDMQNQLESLRSELANLHGRNEQLARDLADVQRQQKDVTQNVQDRLSRFEPAKVTVDGREFMADPVEKRDFEAALAIFRKGEFAAAQTAFADVIRRYPTSGYLPSMFFWLGNAQYATRNYKDAMGNFRALLTQVPDHLRAPEAVLSIANCQIELKDMKAARRTLEDLLKAYPQSEAAATAKERLARLK